MAERQKVSFVMYIYYFSKPIKRAEQGKCDYGNFSDKMISDYKTFISTVNKILKNNYEAVLTAKEIKSINRKKVPDFDCYAVQGFCDGFGNDTYTITITKTYEEAKEYIKKYYYVNKIAIVGQYFNKEYRNMWE